MSDTTPTPAPRVPEEQREALKRLAADVGYPLPWGMESAGGEPVCITTCRGSAQILMRGDHASGSDMLYAQAAVNALPGLLADAEAAEARAASASAEAASCREALRAHQGIGADAEARAAAAEAEAAACREALIESKEHLEEWMAADSGGVCQCQYEHDPPCRYCYDRAVIRRIDAALAGSAGAALLAELAAARARVAELAEGLRPFAEYAGLVAADADSRNPVGDACPPPGRRDLTARPLPTLGDCRRAAELLRKGADRAAE